MGYWYGIPARRGWQLFLTAVNLAGFAYGMEWYRGQLAGVPFYFWPVTADCPVSALLFGLVTASLALGRPQRWLEGLAYVASLKYGLWTVLVIAHSWWAGAPGDADSFHLFWTHLGMVGEAVLFGMARPPLLQWVGLGTGWVMLNTALDYGLGLHPTLPPQTPLALAWGASVGLGMVSVGFYAALAVKRGRGAKPGECRRE